MKTWEDKIKEKFDDYSPEPPNTVWEGISKNLPSPNPVPASGLKSSVFLKAGLAVLSAATILTTAYWLNTQPASEAVTKVSEGITEIVPEEVKETSIESSSSNPEQQVANTQTSPSSSEKPNVIANEAVTAQPVASGSNAPIDLPAGAPSNANEAKSPEPSTKPTEVIVQSASPEKAPKNSPEASPALILNTRGGFAPLKVHAMIAEAEGLADFDFGDGNQALRQNSATHTYQNPGTYTMSMTGSDNREQKASIEVLGILPTAFSPNGDGVNDDYVLEGEAIEEINLRIFDRNGRIVYQNKARRISWDGKNLSGNPAESGTYFYDIFAQSVSGGKYAQKGTISLFR